MPLNKDVENILDPILATFDEKIEILNEMKTVDLKGETNYEYVPNLSRKGIPRIRTWSNSGRV